MNKFLTLSLMIFGTNAFAETSGWVNITNIYTPVKGSPFISFSTNALPGCYNNSGAYLPVKQDVGDGKLVYSKLLTSKISNQSIRVYYTVNDVAENYNGWGKCTITGVAMR
jgi:hypothetical protein